MSQACEHQQEEKDPEQPSDRSSPPSDKKPKDCKPGHQSVDEAAMRKKIVVVEEVVEVKMIGSPGVAGGSPPPVAAVTEATGEEVDMDVLEAFAIKRAVLSGADAASSVPEDDWDHSLDEPEDKTWPNFLEGQRTVSHGYLWVPLATLPSLLPVPFCVCDVTDVARVSALVWRVGGLRWSLWRRFLCNLQSNMCFIVLVCEGINKDSDIMATVAFHLFSCKWQLF